MFRRILLWFGGLLLFSFAGFILTTRLVSRNPAQQPLFVRLHTFQYAESVRHYESGGKTALAAWLGKLDKSFPAKHYLVSADGRDLVTGESRSALLSIANRRPRLVLPPPDSFVIRRTSPDGRYAFLVHVLRADSPFANTTVYAWIVVVIVMLCYVLARSLVKPVRQLRDTVVRFGQGDLSSRVNSRRRDEVGDLARAFDTMADRIQTLLHAERRLLQDISHELRSPLARLRFAVELTKMKTDRLPEFAKVDREIERLSTLVGELVQVTRAEGDIEARSITHIDLPVFLAGIVEDCRVEASAAGIKIAFDTPQRLPWRGDQELLRRAAENVVRNAVAHAPAGTTVEVQLRDEIDRAVIAVRDYGPGVPESELTDIFRPFYRVEEDRNRNNGGGVGLGLAIVERAVRLHHGNVSARNVSPGLLVELTLPK